MRTRTGRRRGALARRALLASPALAIALAAAPAAAAPAPSATLELLTGGLTLSAPEALELPPVRLLGAPVSVESPLATLTVSDTRPGTRGWTVVASATPLTDALGRPIGATLTLLAPPPADGVTPGEGGVLDQPRAVASAPSGSGSGAVRLEPRLRLLVPSDAPTGRYTARIVLTAT